MTEERVITEPNENATADNTRVHAEETAALPEKKKRNRSSEMLDKLNPKNMSSGEMISYISFLRNEREKATAKIKALEDNCKSAYEKVRSFDKKFSDCLHRMEQAYNYAENCAAQAYKAIYQKGT